MKKGTQTTIQRRLTAVRKIMLEAKLDALLITTPENRQYLTGFLSLDHEAGSALITADHLAVLTDQRYSEQVAEESPDAEINYNPQRDPMAAVIGDQLRAWGWQNATTAAQKKALGFDANHLTVNQYNELRKVGLKLFRLVATDNLVEPLRVAKDDDEIEMTRRATAITGKTFDHLLDFMREPGLTEQQVAAEIVATMLRLGADGLAFDPIVAGGPMGARPHAVPGDRVLEPNVPIVIDMGARVGGYCADMTRTVFLDGAPKKWAKRYEQVLAVQELIEKKIHAGMTGKQADALARETFAKDDLAEAFTHGLGHGTGLNIHEGPSMSKRDSADVPMPERSIVTIEPGIYLSGEGGIRIEDAAVLTPKGCDILTTAPKALDAMIIQRRKAKGHHKSA